MCQAVLSFGSRTPGPGVTSRQRLKPGWKMLQLSAVSQGLTLRVKPIFIQEFRGKVRKKKKSRTEDFVFLCAVG